MKYLILFNTIQLLILVINQQCPYNDEKCLSCAGTKCTLCIGSFINKNGVCEVPEKKIWRCMMYNSDGSCQGCKYGYYLTPEGTCEAINIAGCLQVDYNNNCIMCTEQIMVKDGICNPKNKCFDINCKYCASIDQSEKCLVCNENYAVFILKDEYKCIKEKETNKNCWIVTNGNIELCGICKINYFYKEGNCEKSDEYVVFMNSFLLFKSFFFFLLFIL